MSSAGVVVTAVEPRTKLGAVITPVETIVEPVVNAPATSTAPEKSPVAASSSPEIVKFLCPDVSMFASVVTTLEAIAVPAVRPSSSSSSASARTALPAVNAVPVSYTHLTLPTSAIV